MEVILFSLLRMGGLLHNGINNGKSIAYVNNGNLCTMNADGSEQKVITGINDFEAFQYFSCWQ